MKPDGDAGARELFVVTSDGSVRERLGAVAVTHRCRARVIRKPASAPYLNIGCGFGMGLSARIGVARDGSTLRVSGVAQRDITLPAHGELTLDPTIVDDTAPGCLPVAPGVVTPIVVKADRVKRGSSPGEPEAWELVARVPLLNLEYREALVPTEYCHGRLLSAANDWSVTCLASESSSTLRIWIEDAMLFGASVAGSYDGESVAELGGVIMHCGGKLSWPKVHWPNPKWSPVGNCPHCQYPSDLCLDRCAETMTGPDGRYTDKGLACRERCQAAFDKCWRPCMGLNQRGAGAEDESRSPRAGR